MLPSKFGRSHRVRRGLAQVREPRIDIPNASDESKNLSRGDNRLTLRMRRHKSRRQNETEKLNVVNAEDKTEAQEVDRQSYRKNIR